MSPPGRERTDHLVQRATATVAVDDVDAGQRICDKAGNLLPISPTSPQVGDTARLLEPQVRVSTK
jgi:hypothetical protein